jgi:hypothetical protein
MVALLDYKLLSIKIDIAHEFIIMSSYSSAPAGAATGQPADARELSVPVTSLDEFIAAGGGVPDILKIDVEGAEEMVLRGAARLLAGRGPALFLSTHGREIHRECCRLLAGQGYRLEPIVGANVETATELLCRRG